jgi:hypothetical protein
VISVKGIAAALHSRGSKGRLMLFLTAYFDESGDFADPASNFTGMSGWFAPIKVWEELEDKWEALVKNPPFGLTKAFHMKWFAHGKQQFEGWSQTKKDDLYKAIIAIIVESEAIPTGCVVSNSAFSSLSARQQEVLRSPYFTALQECVRGAVAGALLFEGTEKVAMVFAAQKTYGTVTPQGEDRRDNAGFTEKLYYDIKRHIPAFTPYMGAYGSGEMEDMIPLQVADVLAYEMTKEYESILTSNRKMRASYRELMRNTGPRPLIKYLDRLQLLRILRESGCPFEEGMEELDETGVQQIFDQHLAQHLINERRGGEGNFPLRQPKWITDEIMRRIQ